VLGFSVPNVLLLVFPGFSEFEITVAMAVLRGGFTIHTTALDDTAVVSEAGLTVMPHLSVSQVHAADYGALIIPGGQDLSLVWDDECVLDLVRAIHAGGKLLASICAGGVLLAKAGVLVGRPYTVSLYRRFRDTLGCFDEHHFRYEPVIESGNLITAQGFAFVEFGLRLGERLRAMKDPEGVRAYYQGLGDIRWEG
jgi:putative intracellular protease/amidase